MCRIQQRGKLCPPFFFSPCFRAYFLCIALDLGTKIHTHALRENVEPTIVEIRCDRHRFASKSETNLVFICLSLFYVFNHLYFDRRKFRLRVASCFVYYINETNYDVFPRFSKILRILSEGCTRTFPTLFLTCPRKIRRCFDCRRTPLI